MNLLTIPGELLAPDVTYQFVVAVKNFLREVTQKTISAGAYTRPLFSST